MVHHFDIESDKEASRDSSVDIREWDWSDDITSTNTIKLFFPESNLGEGTYFVTLEFCVMVSAKAYACRDSIVSVFAGAQLGAHIIDAEVIKDGDFGKDYGLVYVDGPIKGLLSRVVIVIDEAGKVAYTEQVQETVDEPNYKAALEALMDA